MRKLVMLAMAFVMLNYLNFNISAQFSWLIMLLLVTLFLLNFNSFINLMIILEFLVLNSVLLIMMESSGVEVSYWNIFSILVFSAIEASVGLALLVYLARIWGSVMKIASFN